MLTQKLYKFLINANSTKKDQKICNKNKKKNITFYFRIEGQDRR